MLPLLATHIKAFSAMREELSGMSSEQFGYVMGDMFAPATLAFVVALVLIILERRRAASG